MQKYLLVFLLTSSLYSFAQLKSPREFLPTTYGEEFTPHHLLVDYLEHSANNSDKIKLETFGYTNEDRPQIVAYISSPENIKNLENIRLTNLYNIGLIDKAPSTQIEKALIWLSYSVHGNEAAGSESAMSVVYELINSNDPKIKQWLNAAVIIINPSLNPDGYSRYTSWQRGIAGHHIMNNKDDREHNEVWPGGRVSHYLFDLNRDWAWQTQKESQNFISLYNKWMPHVHADLHEMGYNEFYYFAPAAQPYHQVVSDFQRKFQIEIGKNNAKYFDEKGWLYFTREIFDLFYPSYGDTYPTFNGAIGMTYEKAGIRAGRSIDLNNGDVLPLSQRIEEHKTSSMATIEVCANNAQKLVSEFKNYFIDTRKNLKGKYKTYVLKKSAKTQRLAKLLDKNQIQYGYAEEQKTLTGFHYQSSSNKSFNVAEGDMIIHANQPKAAFTQVLMELEQALVDSNTYDITSWTLPLAYNIDCYGMTNAIDIKTKTKPSKATSIMQCQGKQYAYVLPWDNMLSAQMTAQLYQKGYVLRMAKVDVAFEKLPITKGSIIVARADNKTKTNFDEEVINTIRDHEGCNCLSTGMSSLGGDIGGNAFELLARPKVLTISGENTSNNEVGQIWHYFDEVLNYPITISDINDFNSIDLDKYNTIILPDGWYQLSKEKITELGAWTSKGNKLITMAGALENFLDKEGWALSLYATDEEKENAKKDKTNRELIARKDSYHDYNRRNISENIPGSIIENILDTSHPLCFGLGEKYFSLKTSTQRFKLLKNCWNPVYVPTSYKSYGFIGSKIKKDFEETFTYAVESKGSGNVIYMVDNPLFRGFWENGNLLFSNALFLVK